MSDASLPWSWLARPPTDDEKAYQDAQLQPHLDGIWASGIIDPFRADVEIVHEHLAGLRAQAVRAPVGSQEVVRATARYFAEYEHLVLAMASAGDDRRLIPVDMWPDVLRGELPVYAHTRRTTYVFQLLLNVMLREAVGLFTPNRLLLNRHYTILFAHLVAHPHKIVDARDLPRPYPWPMVIRLDREGTPQLDPQQDLKKPLEGMARRIRKALQRSFTQAGRAEWGTLPKPQAQPSDPPETCKMQPGKRQLGELAVALTKEHPGASWRFIRGCEEFIGLQKDLGITISRDDQLSRLVKDLMGPQWRKLRGRY